ncbi:MAG: hypothetical protein QM582_12980, partial [Micropruina sp.]|uniref:hypothetical protein n=1 Tax=Micropruina sp. TaxID=2737536 RepID=UPI0039E455F6
MTAARTGLPRSAIGSRVFVVEGPDGLTGYAAEYERPLAASVLFAGLRSDAPLDLAVDDTGVSVAAAGTLTWRDADGQARRADPGGERAWRWHIGGGSGPVEPARHRASAEAQAAGWAA